MQKKGYPKEKSKVEEKPVKKAMPKKKKKSSKK